MSQRFRRAPFHRRVLPWIFALSFAVIAPAVVLYTAGYRWNPAKQKIERNGTVIFDSTPTGADIWIDGRPTGDQTPVTLQDMPPGIHRFKIERPGFHPWEKSLEVKPEHVTFVNDVWLWRDGQPSRSLAEPVSRLSISPDGRTSVSFTSASPTVAIMSERLLGGSERATFREPLPVNVQFDWSSDNRHFLIESPDDDRAWLLDSRSSASPIDLPPAKYRWDNGELVGVTNNEQYVYRLSDGSLARTILPPGATDVFDESQLRHVTGTSDLALVADARPDTGFLLPRGDWKFSRETDDHFVFEDGSHWLSLERRRDVSGFQQASGDFLRPIIRGRETLYLLVNGTELWIWNVKDDPQLVYRQSEPIRNAVWHEAGVTVFFATKNQVFALSLDPRDGFLMTPLATFEDISDIAYRDNQLLIAGTKDGQSGVWTVELE